MELFDIVDKNDQKKGIALRSEVHGRPDLIHRVSHVLVFNSRKQLFLQKRADDKDVQPGKWDTSVGGHLDSGESYAEAALREMKEELGVTEIPAEFLYKYLHRNSYESEYVSTFLCFYDGPFHLQQSEISDGRFWSVDEIEAERTSALFTPNFIDEWNRFRQCRPGFFQEVPC